MSPRERHKSKNSDGKLENNSHGGTCECIDGFHFEQLQCGSDRESKNERGTIVASKIQINLVTLLPFGSRNDRLITNTARQGFYLVHLFRSDLSGVYRSLKKGVTSIRDVYGADGSSEPERQKLGVLAKAR
jgi:hypothetical protein